MAALTVMLTHTRGRARRSAWYRARKVYEVLQAKDEEEVIMYDEEGLVTEGLSSNAFAIIDVRCRYPG
jgi:branched-subunit amino acid aminotransferase/4-amino-4-deoxychorismate lyase